MLSNMFDPQAETESGWEVDIRDDVLEECNSHGGPVLHIHVDTLSQVLYAQWKLYSNNVYCKKQGFGAVIIEAIQILSTCYCIRVGLLLVVVFYLVFQFCLA